MVLCLTGVRFNMKADILRQGYVDGSDFNPTDEAGEWKYQQDPDSGEIVRLWQANTLDDPNTPNTNEAAILEGFSCLARGIVDGGIRVAGTTERMGQQYENIDYVKLQFPASINISKRDRVTNIRTSDGKVIWKEEEQPGSPPTVYDVMGVTPILDPFGKHVENFAMLARSERQG